MSETTVGAIVGSLRLNIADFEAGIAKAIGLADRLDGKDVNVDINVDSAGAETKLAAVAASEEKVDRGNTKVAKSGRDAGKGMGAMATAIITLGPALVPLAAGATGLAVGFGAMGAAGILAVVGIAQEMKAGSTLGNAYTGMLVTLKGNLSTLSRTAASGVLQPFQVSVAALQAQMPKLNGIVGAFSVITGKTAGALTSGLVAAFISLAPLARDAGVYILNLSTRFAELMSGPGVVSFGDYARSVFPQVMAAVESIVGAAIRLVAAFAPLGMGTLTVLQTLADLINAIPVDVLSTLATVAGAVYLGFKGYGVLAVGVRAVGASLEFMGAAAATTATTVGILSAAAAGIGVIIAVAAFAFTSHAEAARTDQEAVNSLTDALIANGGAISDNAIKEQALKLAKDGTLAAAKEQGYAIQDVTLASMGNAEASARVTAHTKDLQAAWVSSADAGGDFTGTLQEAFPAVKKVTDATKDGTTTLGLAVSAYQAYNAATAKAATGGNAEAIALQAVATKAGTTVAALAGATTAQQKTAEAAAAAAAKMYLENDAAGILRIGLDALNGKSLSLAQAKTADAAATNAATKALRDNGTAIKGNSDAAILNQQALQNKASASQREAEAVAKATGSTKAGVAAYKQSKSALEGSLKAQGLLTPAVQAYINTLYDVNNLKVKPTKLDVEKAAAEKKLSDLQAKINAIKQGKVPGLDANSAAGRAVVAGLQAYMDALKQGVAPPLNANATPGEIATAGLQTYIDRIRQGKVPGMDVDTAAGKEMIRLLQAQIDALRDGDVTINTYINTIRTAVNRVATGPGGTGGLTEADGGVLNAYASGGFENHVAQIAPAGAMRLWAEPETGGEAYIPLAAGKRARSTAIWEETGRRLGVAPGQTQAAAPQVNVYIDGQQFRGMIRTTLDGHTKQLVDSLIYGGV